MYLYRSRSSQKTNNIMLNLYVYIYILTGNMKSVDHRIEFITRRTLVLITLHMEQGCTTGEEP